MHNKVINMIIYLDRQIHINISHFGLDWSGFCNSVDTNLNKHATLFLTLYCF